MFLTDGSPETTNLFNGENPGIKAVFAGILVALLAAAPFFCLLHTANLK
jgi:hypothetical protein